MNQKEEEEGKKRRKHGHAYTVLPCACLLPLVYFVKAGMNKYMAWLSGCAEVFLKSSRKVWWNESLVGT